MALVGKVSWDEYAIKNSDNNNLKRIKFADGEPVRVKILPELSDKKIYSHFIKGKGSFLCATPVDERQNKAFCCKRLPEGDAGAKPKIINLVVKYMAKDMGKKVISVEDDPLVWEISPTARDRILKAVETAQKSIFNVDVIIHPSGSGMSRKYEYEIVDSTKKIVESEEFIEVKEAAKELYDNIENRLHKKYTEEQLDEVLKEISGGEDDVNINDLDIEAMKNSGSEGKKSSKASKTSAKETKAKEEKADDSSVEDDLDSLLDDEDDDDLDLFDE